MKNFLLKNVFGSTVAFLVFSFLFLAPAQTHAEMFPGFTDTPNPGAYLYCEGDGQVGYTHETMFFSVRSASNPGESQKDLSMAFDTPGDYLFVTSLVYFVGEIGELWQVPCAVTILENPYSPEVWNDSMADSVLSPSNEILQDDFDYFYYGSYQPGYCYNQYMDYMESYDPYNPDDPDVLAMWHVFFNECGPFPLDIPVPQDYWNWANGEYDQAYLWMPPNDGVQNWDVSKEYLFLHPFYENEAGIVPEHKEEDVTVTNDSASSMSISCLYPNPIPGMNVGCIPVTLDPGGSTDVSISVHSPIIPGVYSADVTVVAVGADTFPSTRTIAVDYLVPYPDGSFPPHNFPGGGGGFPVGDISSPAPHSCVIATGQSTCSIPISWTVVNAGSGSVVVDTGGNILGTGNNGNSVSMDVGYDSETFYLYNNYMLLDLETVSASCDIGDAWNGSACVDAGTLALNDAEFISQSVPTIMITGQSYPVSVKFRNIGSNTWSTASNYQLGAENPQDNATWGLSRVNIPGGVNVATGEQHTYSFTVTAPATPGTYNFQWRSVQETVERFGEMSPNVSVSVQNSLVEEDCTNGVDDNGDGLVDDEDPACATDPDFLGQCGASSGQYFDTEPTSGFCTGGTFTNFSGSGPWTWTCQGTNPDGLGRSCSTLASPTGDPTPGQCGSSNGQTLADEPTGDLCDVGASTAVSGSGPWSWQCLGENGGADAQCNAYLQPTPPSGDWVLIVTPSTGGDVKSDDGGVNCGSTCLAGYDDGATVTLRAVPWSAYWKFTGWSGDCGGAGICTLNMTEDKDAHASFAPRSLNYIEF